MSTLWSGEPGVQLVDLDPHEETIATSGDSSMIREVLLSIRELWATRNGRLLLVGVFNVLLIGTLFYRLVEKWSWVDSLYFTVVTLTTVGYGDLAPTGDMSKLFTLVLIVCGVGLIVSFLNHLVSMSVKRRIGRDAD